MGKATPLATGKHSDKKLKVFSSNKSLSKLLKFFIFSIITSIFLDFPKFMQLRSSGIESAPFNLQSSAHDLLIFHRGELLSFTSDLKNCSADSEKQTRSKFKS